MFKQFWYANLNNFFLPIIRSLILFIRDTGYPGILPLDVADSLLPIRFLNDFFSISRKLGCNIVLKRFLNRFSKTFGDWNFETLEVKLHSFWNFFLKVLHIFFLWFISSVIEIYNLWIFFLFCKFFNFGVFTLNNVAAFHENWQQFCRH